LSILTAVADVLDTAGDFTYHSYSYLYASVGKSYRKESVDKAISGLAEEGFLEKNERGEIRLTITGAGIKKRLYQERQKKWDGKWRVVFFDIPEDRREIRDDLRSELKKLGFGRWQRSAWLTPFDITKELNSYLREQDLSGLVQIVVGERFGESSDRDFAAKVWPLDEINNRYQHLLSGWSAELKKESTAEERLEATAVFQNQYFDILTDDPQLPEELLPTNWVGKQAAELFDKLKSFLTVVGR
jgi:phenylacetic acid degradation operon negative regulatory protein